MTLCTILSNLSRIIMKNALFIGYRSRSNIHKYWTHSRSSAEYHIDNQYLCWKCCSYSCFWPYGCDRCYYTSGLLQHVVPQWSRRKFFYVTDSKSQSFSDPCAIVSVSLIEQGWLPDLKMPVYALKVSHNGFCKHIFFLFSHGSPVCLFRVI